MKSSTQDQVEGTFHKIKGKVKEGVIAEYQVNLMVTFVLDD